MASVDVRGITDDVVKRYKDLNKDDLFNLSVYDTEKGNVEKFLNVTVKPNGSPRRLDRVLGAESSLVRVQGNQGNPVLASKPAVSKPEEDPSNPKSDPAQYKKFTSGVDSQALTDADIIGDPDQKTGIQALEKADLFNILCIPPDNRGGTVSQEVLAAALAYCVKRHAILIVDPPKTWTPYR